MEKLLQITLADAIDFLDAEHVSYALIGGLASSLRGEPRVTADVDLVIGSNVDGALQLIQSLEGSPFAPLFEGVEEVVSRAFILPLRHRTTAVKVDRIVGFREATIGTFRALRIGWAKNQASHCRRSADYEVAGRATARSSGCDRDHCSTGRFSRLELLPQDRESAFGSS